jgi:hypothetical protein
MKVISNPEDYDGRAAACHDFWRQDMAARAHQLKMNRKMLSTDTCSWDFDPPP